MKKNWIKKGIGYFFYIVACALLIGLVVMALWNAILPTVLNVKPISFLQALGILLLSKILFGGFSGARYQKKKEEWKSKMQNKLCNMTPEENEKFKTEWKTRCAGRWKMNSQDVAKAAQEK